MVSPLDSYQPDTLFSLFPVFYSSSQWSQWRLRPGAVSDSLSLSVPSSIYPPHLAVCQTEQCHQPSLQILSVFVFLFSSLHLGTYISLPFPFLLHPSIYLLVLFSPHSSHSSLPSEETAATERCLKIEAAEKRKVMDI